jgi:hypothetical protein
MRNPKCQGANSTHVTARLASKRVAFAIHLDHDDVPTLAHAPPPPPAPGGGGVGTNAIVGGLEEAVGTAFGGGLGIETTLPLMAAG